MVVAIIRGKERDLGGREVTYALTGTDLASANRWVLMGWGAQLRLVAVWLVLGCVLAVYGAVRTGQPLRWMQMVFFITLAALICYEVFLFVYVTFAARRSFLRMDVLRLRYTLKWSADNFEWTSDRTRHAYSLQDLKRWTEQKDKFLMHTNDNMLWVVGKRFFDTPQDIDSLRNELLKIADR